MEDVCGICGTRHHPRQAHRWAKADVTEAPCIGPGVLQGNDEVFEDSPTDPGDRGLGEGGAGNDGETSASLRRGTKQRWSREAYNAYQREYMRRRRSKVG